MTPPPSKPSSPPPVLTIDGPAGVGKTSVAARVAVRLGWGLLISGLLYRAAALLAAQAGADLDAELRALQVVFEPVDDGVRTRVNGVDRSAELASEACGEEASRRSSDPALRRLLLPTQRRFRRAPGLVAEGRDMGTVVFPDAACKIFLNADAAERARRRHAQLKQRGIHANLAELRQSIEARDARDAGRAASPLRVAADALEIDTTHKTLDSVVDEIVALAAGKAR